MIIIRNPAGEARVQDQVIRQVDEYEVTGLAGIGFYH